MTDLVTITCKLIYLLAVRPTRYPGYAPAVRSELVGPSLVGDELRGEIVAGGAANLGVVYIAPAFGASGVGDYAYDVMNALAARGVDICSVATGGPGADSLSDVVKTKRAVRQAIAVLRERHSDVILHADLSAGCIAPFWAMGASANAKSAVVHDPPQPVWWPIGTRWISASRLRKHGLHYPFRRAWAWLQTRVLSDVHLLALTDAGRESLLGTGLSVNRIDHYVRQHNNLTPISSRPRAVGLYGYVYGGKGFSELVALRDAFPSDVAIHVAGRGTERLDPIDGVEIWGEVDEVAESRFFASIRCLLLPYVGDNRYGHFRSASGALARAYSHGTPAVAPPVRSFTEEARRDALSIAGPTPAAIAAVAERLLDATPIEIERQEKALETIRRDRAPQAVAESMIAYWHELSNSLQRG